MAHDDDERTNVHKPSDDLYFEDDEPTFVGGIDAIEETTRPSTKTLGARRKTQDVGELPEKTSELPDLRARIAQVKAERGASRRDSQPPASPPRPPRPSTDRSASAKSSHVIRDEDLRRSQAGPVGRTDAGSRRNSAPSLPPRPSPPVRPSRPSQEDIPDLDTAPLAPVEDPDATIAPSAVSAELPRAPLEPPSRAQGHAPDGPAAVSAELEQEVAEILAAAQLAEGMNPDVTGNIPDLHVRRNRDPSFISRGRDVENPFAASMSGFYALPDVTTDEEVETGIPRTLTLAAIAGATLFGVVTTFSVGLREWWSPQQMMTWQMVVTAAIAVAGVVALLWQEEKIPGLRAAISAAIPALLTLIVGMFAALSWGIPGVRAAFVGVAAADPLRMEAVFEDDSDTVALAACERLGGLAGNPEWERVILAGATLRPAVAPACLSGHGPGETQILGATLADRWTRELQNPDVVTAETRACDLSSAMTTLPVPEPEVDARLLSCAMSSPSPDAQRCCGQTLSSRIDSPAEWIQRLRATSDVLVDEKTALALFGMSFGVGATTAGQNELLSSAGFTGAPAQSVALEFSCSTAQGGSLEATRYFGASLEGSCAIDAGRLPSGREVWVDVCSRVVPRLTNVGVDPKELLCDATRTTLIEKATQTARDLVQAAVRKRSQQKLESGIVAGTDFLENAKPKFRKPGMSDEMKAALRGDRNGPGMKVTPAFREKDFGSFRPPDVSRFPGR